MRVQSIQFTPYIRQQNLNYQTKPYDYDSVSFGAKKDNAQFKKAQKYANKMKLLNKIWPSYLQNYDMNKIEGIQKGIPIFEGLSIPEIAFMFEDLHAIAVKRGCSNQCFHCYAGAEPAGREHDNYITRMPYEDFVEVTSGIKELKKRIGFAPLKYHGKPYTDLFYDTDGMEISLFDKNGREYDFTELHDMLHDALDTNAVFDTAGWNPNSPKMQKRAEKYVKYFMDLENIEKMHQINLSISPFNVIYMKAIELGFEPSNYDIKNQPWHPQNEGKPLSKEETLYNIYINRMANMLLTFSPLLGEDKFSVIARPVSNFEKNMKYHTEADYQIVKDQILETLQARLYMDLKNEQKYVKSEDGIKCYIYEYDTLLSETDTDLIMSGRFEKLYKEKNPNVTQEYIDTMFDPIAEFRENFENLQNTGSLEKLDKKFLKMIDANGKLYLYDGFRMLPTEIALNIPSKGKDTPLLSPSMEDFVVTTEMVKDYYKK